MLKPIISIFSPGDKLKVVAMPLLRFTSIFAFMDSINVICLSAIEGAGDVKFASRLTKFYIWILLLPLSYLTGIYLDIGLWGPWYSLLFAVLIVTILFFLRIKQGKWKYIVV